MIFQNLDLALKWYLSNQKLTQDEYNKLQKLSEKQIDSFVPIWEAYKSVKDQEELLEELKILLSHGINNNRGSVPLMQA